jgi:hypothetical protein
VDIGLEFVIGALQHSSCVFDQTCDCHTTWNRDGGRVSWTEIVDRTGEQKTGVEPGGDGSSDLPLGS